MIDKKFEARQSILGLRGSFGAILELYKENNDFKIVTADTATSAGLGRLKASSSDLFVECGISEQSAVAIATGIALENIEVFLGSFSPFIIGRGWEQIRLASYMNANLTIFGFGAGIGLSYLGYTHCSLEDCSLLNSIPETVIFEPSTPSQIYEAIRDSKNFPGISYIRLTGDGPINRNILDGFTKISNNMRLFKKGSKKLIVCSGYLASRLFNYHSENFDFLLMNQISNMPYDQNLHSVLKNYTDVFCFHESYSNLIFDYMSDIKTQALIHDISPKKIFTKPGCFEYVCNELDFDIFLKRVQL